VSFGAYWCESIDFWMLSRMLSVDQCLAVIVICPHDEAYLLHVPAHADNSYKYMPGAGCHMKCWGLPWKKKKSNSLLVGLHEFTLLWCGEVLYNDMVYMQVIGSSTDKGQLMVIWLMPTWPARGVRKDNIALLSCYGLLINIVHTMVLHELLSVYTLITIWRMNIFY